jgi:hypothetical protein
MRSDAQEIERPSVSYVSDPTARELTHSTPPPILFFTFHFCQFWQPCWTAGTLWTKYQQSGKHQQLD